MTLIKNITEGLLFVETQEGLKGLKPEETMVVEECLNCATLIEAGFLATVAEVSEEEENAEQEGEATVVEGSEEENAEQEGEATVVDGSEEENAEQEGEAPVVEGSEEGQATVAEGSEESEATVVEGSEEENAEQDQKEEIKDEVVKTKKTQAKKNK